jgi:hypothetical protein
LTANFISRQAANSQSGAVTYRTALVITVVSGVVIPTIGGIPNTTTCHTDPLPEPLSPQGCFAALSMTIISQVVIPTIGGIPNTTTCHTDPLPEPLSPQGCFAALSMTTGWVVLPLVLSGKPEPLIHKFMRLNRSCPHQRPISALFWVTHSGSILTRRFFRKFSRITQRTSASG